MKTVLLPVFVLLGITTAFSQGFKSGKIDASRWDTDVVLTLQSAQGNGQIKIDTKSEKARRAAKKIKQVSINNHNYQLIESCGRINILNTRGEILLKTNRDRSEIFLQNNERFFLRKQIKGSNGTFEYVNDAQKVVVSGQVKGGVIELTNCTNPAREALIALCLEELLQHAYDRYLNAIMTSSFLAMVD